MKLHQIALAVAVLAAGSANAANKDLAADLVIALDGATAVAGSVVDVASYMCKAGTLGTGDYQVYSAGKNKAVFCPVDGAKTGLVDGTKVFLSKNNVDGSLESLQRAMMRQTADGGIPANSNALGQTSLPDSTQCDPVAKTCVNTMQYAQGGLSDVNAGTWEARGQYNPNLVTGGVIEFPGLAGQGFGLAVSGALYQALQAAQGLTVGVPADGYNMTAADLANQPSINRNQYASILAAGGGYHADWSPIVGAAGAGKPVVLCRRGTNSGTQASMDSFFLSFPCSSSGVPSALATDSIPGAFEVIENSGTGDVKTCLTSANTAGDFGIGVMSLENKWSSGSGWYYVQLDGVSPNEETGQRKSSAEGRYAFVEEMYGVVRGDSSADVQTYMTSFFAAMGNPYAVNPLTGITVVPGTYLWDGTDASLSRVQRGTRFGDACAPMMLFN